MPKKMQLFALFVATTEICSRWMLLGNKRGLFLTGTVHLLEIFKEDLNLTDSVQVSYAARQESSNIYSTFSRPLRKVINDLTIAKTKICRSGFCWGMKEDGFRKSTQKVFSSSIATQTTITEYPRYSVSFVCGR